MKPKFYLVDQDHTIVRNSVKNGPDHYLFGIQKAVLNSLPAEATAHRNEVSSEAWLIEHKDLWRRGVCYYTCYQKRYGIDRVKLFDRFHDCIDTAGLSHDTESGAVLNQIADRAVILTDANLSWAKARASQVGHKLRLLTRSCMIEQGLFEAQKADHDRPWFNALENLRVITGQSDLQPADGVVIDDNVKVLAKARALGFQVVQCLWGNAPPAPEYPHTPQVAAFLRTHGLA